MPTETRAETVKRERRWKPGPVGQEGLKLHVDTSKLDPNFHYRWVNDKSDRVRQMHAYDYDIAPTVAKPDSNSLGTVDSALGGVEEDGRPYNMVLMRKDREWFEQDQKRKMKPLDEMDEAIRRGNGTQTDPNAKGGFYTPGQNQL